MAAKDKENYWEWLDDNLNMNGICIDYEIGMPENIREVRVYGVIGDIHLENMKAVSEIMNSLNKNEQLFRIVIK